MKIKIILITVTALLLVISLLQVLPLPPYAGDIAPLYRSGYFLELDRQFEVIRDAFLGIKMMGRPEYAWIFLDDMKKGHGLAASVYNSRGEAVKAPGEASPGVDPVVISLVNSANPRTISEVRGGRYYAALPVSAADRCRFCHAQRPGSLVGVLTFERDFDAHVYYTRERVIIFSMISLVLVILLAALARWDPEKKIKELFDK
jgi:hypothetical protein